LAIFDEYASDGISVVMGDPSEGVFVTITPQKITEVASRWVPPPVLYHGTSTAHSREILAVGLDAPNHWGYQDVARFFARSRCRDDGGRPIIITQPFSDFYADGFKVDENMIDFPIVGDIRKIN
jgi:hypothetical protein